MTTKATLSEEVIKLATSIREQLEIDTDTGVVTEKDTGGAYDYNLPHGITKDTIKTISNYNTTYVAASTYAVGQVALEAFNANTKLNRCSGKLRMGHKDDLEVIVDKSDKSEYTIHGSLDIRASKNSGQLKAARDAIKEMGANALLNK
jgi:hypothetical protein